jgi:cyclopropane-fatty-acyl-phospholipid synthase
MTTVTAALVDRAVDRGLLPDPVLRAAIRQLLRRRLRCEDPGGPAARADRKHELLAVWRHAPVALHTDDANDQHYEVPTELFELMLGPRLKYSSAYWPAGVTTLAEAEEAMLSLTSERAELADGQEVLELGCGWGSLTLWMAARYPNSRITAVSNSATQRELIEKRAAALDLANVTVVTRDINDFGVDAAGSPDPALTGRFDRVVSVEMFEHVRNHAELLRRVATWLRPDGKFFVHVFAHRDLLYPFETGGQADWMARHFFTGGVMPSHDLFLHLNDDLVVESSWAVDGTHYARTLEAWLERLDDQRDRVRQLFADTYGAADADVWYHRWRVFNLASAELFGFRGGTEWHVSHHRLVPR